MNLPYFKFSINGHVMIFYLNQNTGRIYFKKLNFEYKITIFFVGKECKSY